MRYILPTDALQMIKMQVKEVLQHPETLRDAPHPIIYHELLKEVHGRKIPTESSLRDEAVLLVAAGTETVSNAAIVGTMHIIANRNIYTRLQTELREAWPNLEERPRYEALERLVYLVGSPITYLGHSVNDFLVFPGRAQSSKSPCD